MSYPLCVCIKCSSCNKPATIVSEYAASKKNVYCFQSDCFYLIAEPFFANLRQKCCLLFSNFFPVISQSRLIIHQPGGIQSKGTMVLFVICFLTSQNLISCCIRIICECLVLEYNRRLIRDRSILFDLFMCPAISVRLLYRNDFHSILN